MPITLEEVKKDMIEILEMLQKQKKVEEAMFTVLENLEKRVYTLETLVPAPDWDE